MDTAYGTDETPDYEALAEATRLADGTIHFTTVLLAK